MKKLFLIAVLIALYLIFDFTFVAPYMVRSLPEPSGYVTSSTTIQVSSLPSVINQYIPNQSTVTIFLIREPGLNSATYAVISNSPPPVGTFVIVESYMKWYVDWHDFPLNAQFSQLVLASSVHPASRGFSCPWPSPGWILSVRYNLPSLTSCVDNISVPSTTITALSTFVFYIGPWAIALIVYGLERRFYVWPLLGVVWIYSFRALAAHSISSALQVAPSSGVAEFGYLFYALPVVILVLIRLEDKNKLQQLLSKFLDLGKPLRSS